MESIHDQAREHFKKYPWLIRFINDDETNEEEGGARFPLTLLYVPDSVTAEIRTYLPDGWNIGALTIVGQRKAAEGQPQESTSRIARLMELYGSKPLEEQLSASEIENLRVLMCLSSFITCASKYDDVKEIISEF